MYIRRPSAAGSFYPSDARELNEMIRDFLSQVKGSEKIESAVGVVAPHAGYAFCGKTLAKVYSSVSENSYDTVVLLGPNHYGKGAITTCSGLWQTPIGNLKVDEGFVKELERSEIENSFQVHMWEHSLEVQLPWIIALLGNVKIVPVTINPVFFDVKEMRELGKAIHEAAERLGKRMLCVASSDFTHYGSAYNYVPFRGSAGEILRKIKEEDMKMIRAIEDFAVERIIELGAASTVCGYGAIAAMVHFAKLSGAEHAKLLDYRTSFEVSKSLHAIVAYAGVVVY